MWEDLKIYKQLDKDDINSTFKKFGKAILSNLDGYSIEQTGSIIKISRQINQLEQSIFIARSSGSYELQVKICIKPIDFYKKHRFTMVNIVRLGNVMNNYRRTFYPLTKEWSDLALFLATRIRTEIEAYFERYDSYEKIIDRRDEIEPKDFGIDNKYELLIYAAIRTKNRLLLEQYLDKKIIRPINQISHSEYLKPDNQEINETEFLQTIKAFSERGDFISIENEIAALDGQN